MKLSITLLSDTTFGRGDGVPGEVDAEVQHDALGLPYFGGRALKGVLANECADILFALKQAERGKWHAAGAKLFGSPGSTTDVAGALIVGDARLSGDVQQAVKFSLTEGISPQQILASLTTVRKQTANDVETGTPKDETLRAMRVVLRNTVFTSLVQFRAEVGENELALLAACVKSLRRLGSGRHRGRGEVRVILTDLQDVEITSHFDRFAAEVTQA
jgi:CRISPR/Cas system CSM-associated protein Csm3 (group 7 of RAMP superfamily)